MPESLYKDLKLIVNSPVKFNADNKERLCTVCHECTVPKLHFLETKLFFPPIQPLTSNFLYHPEHRKNPVPELSFISYFCRTVHVVIFFYHINRYAKTIWTCWHLFAVKQQGFNFIEGSLGKCSHFWFYYSWPKVILFWCQKFLEIPHRPL